MESTACSKTRWRKRASHLKRILAILSMLLTTNFGEYYVWLNFNIPQWGTTISGSFINARMCIEKLMAHKLFLQRDKLVVPSCKMFHRVSMRLKIVQFPHIQYSYTIPLFLILLFPLLDILLLYPFFPFMFLLFFIRFFFFFFLSSLLFSSHPSDFRGVLISHTPEVLRPESVWRGFLSDLNCRWKFKTFYSTSSPYTLEVEFPFNSLQIFPYFSAVKSLLVKRRLKNENRQRLAHGFKLAFFRLK